jgi:predicted dehydrogenase
MQNVVIAGFGFMGGMHAQVYARLPRTRVVALVDCRRDAAGANAAKIGLEAPVYGTLEEALARHRAEVVDICLPTHLHAPFARSAMRAGKAVFCEKPFARGAREALALAEAAERSGTIMQVGQCVRFWPEYQAFTAFVAGRSAGRLLSLSLQRRAGRPSYSAGDWLNKPRFSGGAALDLHIHDTDFIHHLLGRPEAVSSRGTRDASGWSHIFTTYAFDRIAVTAEGGWNYPVKWGFQMAFQAVFENGAVEYDSTARPTLVATVGKGARKPLRFREPRVGKSSSGLGNVSALGGYYTELAAFVDCLERGRQPAVATPRQAADSVRTVMAEIRSAETGRTVRL